MLAYPPAQLHGKERPDQLVWFTSPVIFVIRVPFSNLENVFTVTQASYSLALCISDRKLIARSGV